MKAKYYIVLAVMAIGFSLVFSCIKEEANGKESSSNVRLSAVMEWQLPTKTTLSSLIDGKYYPLWNELDSLSVFTEEGQRPVPFHLVSGAGQTTGAFDGPLEGEHFVALFPYYEGSQYKDNQLLFTLPSSQIYRVNSFALNGFPMIAVSEGHELYFKNLCSIIKIPLQGSGVVSGITLHSDKKFLSGPASVGLTYSDAPALVMQEGGWHDVRLDCGSVLLNSDSATDFYIVLPAGEYDDLTISVDSFLGTIVTKSISHEITFRRSELRPVNSFIVESEMIDLDNLPDNQVWYKTKNNQVFSPERWANEPPFNARIISNTYQGEYGVIILETPVTEVNRFAFGWERDIIELHLPDGVKVINAYALPPLDSFRIPGSIERLYNNDNLSNGNIKHIYGPRVASDGRSVVREDGVLLAVLDGEWEEYTTPPEVTQMSEYCMGTTSIKSLIVSEGVTSISPIYIWGDGIITYAPNLETVYLPESLQLIDCTIENAPNLKGYYGNTRCTSEDHLSLISPRDGTLVSVVQNCDAEVYRVPDGVTFFWAYIMNWPNLKRIYVPSSLDNILHDRIINCPNFEGFEGPGASEDGRCIVINGNLLYYYGNGQKEYETPSSVTTIRKFVFREDIEKLVVNEGVKILDDHCFQYATSLKTLYLPKTTKIISEDILLNDLNIESVYLPVRTPPEVYGAPHSSSLPKLKVYVPEESLEDYMNNIQWQAAWSDYLVGYHFDDIDPDNQYSTDYSADGVVTVLQEASEGNGIDLVLMGDAFTDREIADGTYLRKMEEAVEAFFETEPQRSYRYLFNVYVVNAVSESNFVWSEPHVFNSIVWYDNSIETDTNKCIEYALKAIPDSRLDEASIMLIVNSPYSFKYQRSGTTYMLRRAGTPESDYGSGYSVAAMTSTFELKTLVQHEMGHAFAKLADEYIGRAENDEPISQSDIEGFNAYGVFGWWKNIDFTDDPTKVKWAKFLADSRYENEKLGVYEGGGARYVKGVYRPSMYGTMNDNLGGFNAPSREAIYYRIHKLAYGAEWNYDYEEFVKWDQGAKNIHPTSYSSPSGKRQYEVRQPLPAPEHFDNNWTVIRME